MGTNTTALIHAWSMDGERHDPSVRFESALDIHAALSQRDPDETELDSVPPERPPLLLKGADDEDWRPLLRAVDAD